MSRAQAEWHITPCAESLDEAEKLLRKALTDVAQMREHLGAVE